MNEVKQRLEEEEKQAARQRSQSSATKGEWEEGESEDGYASSKKVAAKTQTKPTPTSRDAMHTVNFKQALMRSCRPCWRSKRQRRANQ